MKNSPALKKKSFIFGDRSKIKTLVFSKNSSFDLFRLVRGGERETRIIRILNVHKRYKGYEIGPYWGNPMQKKRNSNHTAGIIFTSTTFIWDIIEVRMRKNRATAREISDGAEFAI